MELKNKPSPVTLFNMQLIAGAMTASVIIIMLLPVIGLIPLHAPSADRQELITILTAVGILPTLIAPFMQKSIMTLMLKSSNDPLATCMQALILRYALNESGTIFGFVASIVGGTPYPVIICGLVALIGSVLAFPKKT